MGKASRARKADFRKKQKRQRKEAQNALYESYKKSGTNQKSKRNKLNTKRARNLKTASHSAGRCGNHGCSKCGNDVIKPIFKRQTRNMTSLQKMQIKQSKIAERRVAEKLARQTRGTAPGVYGLSALHSVM